MERKILVEQLYSYLDALPAHTELPNSWDFKGKTDEVLGSVGGAWDPEEKKFMEERVTIVVEMIKSFAFAGLERTMTAFNKEGKVPPPAEESVKG